MGRTACINGKTDRDRKIRIVKFGVLIKEVLSSVDWTIANNFDNKLIDIMGGLELWQVAIG